MEMYSAYAGSGMLFHFPEVIDSNDYGALTFAVKGNQSGQDLLVYAIDEDEDIVGTAVWASDYIHGGVLPTDWQVAWIPLRDLMPGGGDFNGIAVEPNVAGTVWLDEVKVVRGLEFPLAVDGADGPYRTRVTSVMDNNGAAFGVMAYNGELGNVKSTCVLSAGSCIYGWKKADGTDFSLPNIEYDDELGSVTRNTELFYDNHRAYDYAPIDSQGNRRSSGAPILAPMYGNLCIPLRSWEDGGKLWRDHEKCPLSADDAPGGNTWASLNTFYIMHENTLSTWYRHADDVGSVLDPVPQNDKGYRGLTKEVYDAIAARGYARVRVGDHVGYVGGATGYSPHLDFAVRIGTEVVDPYRLRRHLPIGSGVLWQQSP
jgi:hypothetical protein